MCQPQHNGTCEEYESAHAEYKLGAKTEPALGWADGETQHVLVFMASEEANR